MKIHQVQEILAMFEASSVAKMELEITDMKLKLEKHPHTNSVQGNSQVVERIADVMQSMEKEDREEGHGEWIKSPIVGTFYSSRSKDGAPFVEIGQPVKKGDVLCIIEAMKVMNEIHSPIDGIVRSILPTNESMVECNQDLIRIGE